MKVRYFIIIIILLFLLTSPLHSENESIARKMYESGMAFYKNGKYEFALKDFDTVIKSFPKTEWAGLSLFQKGIYYREQKADLQEAEKQYERFTQDFPAHRKMPIALVNLGEIQLELSKNKVELNEPIATFERLLRLFPESASAAKAAYLAARAHKKRGEVQKALQKIQKVDKNFKNTGYYPDAILLKGLVLATEGEYVEAARQLQELVSFKRGSEQAKKALRYLAALQRLNLESDYKYKIDSSFSLEKSQEFDEPKSIHIINNKKIVLFDIDLKRIFYLDLKGKLTDAPEVIGTANLITVSNDGKIMLLDREGNLQINGKKIPLKIISDGESILLTEPALACTDSLGNLYVVSSNREHIFRFDRSGSFQTRLSKREFDEIRSISFDIFDHLYVIDDDYDGILIFNQRGGDAGTIKATGAGYKLDEPAVLKFDSFNNLYVYDEDKNVIIVFNNNKKFIKEISLPAPIDEVIDFGITDSGEIFLLDEDKETIYKIY